MEEEVAARSQRLSDPFANRARQSPHRHIVAHQGSGESDKSTNHLSDHNARSGCRKARIKSCEYHVGRHAERRGGKRHERGKISPSPAPPVAPAAPHPPPP